MAQFYEPWRIAGHFDADTTVDIYDANDVPFCELLPFEGDWTPEEIARVALIVAAPQMIETLLEVREWCRSLILSAAAEEPPRVLFKKIVAAIAQAEGRS